MYLQLATKQYILDTQQSFFYIAIFVLSTFGPMYVTLLSLRRASVLVNLVLFFKNTAENTLRSNKYVNTKCSLTARICTITVSFHYENNFDV